MSDLTPEQAFAEALAAFQAAIPVVKKEHTASVKSDKGNYSYAYSPLEDITQVAMPLLAQNGLSFTSKPMMTEHGFVLRYSLLHSAGHREEGDFPLADPSRSTAQQIGSWLTYARRYALCAVTGIAPGGDDDDAQKAGDARAAEPLPRAPRTRGATTRRSGDEIDPQAPDAWTSQGEPERVTDVVWIDGFRQRITAAANARELAALQGEANGVWGEGRLSREDAQALRAEVSERQKELTGAPA